MAMITKKISYTLCWDDIKKHFCAFIYDENTFEFQATTPLTIGQIEGELIMTNNSTTISPLDVVHNKETHKLYFINNEWVAKEIELTGEFFSKADGAREERILISKKDNYMLTKPTLVRNNGDIIKYDDTTKQWTYVKISEETLKIIENKEKEILLNAKTSVLIDILQSYKTQKITISGKTTTVDLKHFVKSLEVFKDLETQRTNFASNNGDDIIYSYKFNDINKKIEFTKDYLFSHSFGVVLYKYALAFVKTIKTEEDLINEIQKASLVSLKQITEDNLIQIIDIDLLLKNLGNPTNSFIKNIF